jgi:hypothetical protein
MSIYPPPDNNSPIFNPSAYLIDNTSLTVNTGDERYLKLSGSIATGLQTLNGGLNTSNLTCQTDATINGRIFASNGSQSAPAISWIAAGGFNSGLYSVGTNDLRVAINGNTRLTIGNTTTISANALQTASGTAASPGVQVGEATTGVYRVSAGILGLSAASTQGLQLTSSQITFPLQATFSSTTVYPNIALNANNRLCFGESNPPGSETGSVVSFGSGNTGRNIVFSLAKTGVRTGFFGQNGSSLVIGNEAGGSSLIFKNGMVYGAADILASGTTLLTLDSNATFTVPISTTGTASAASFKCGSDTAFQISRGAGVGGGSATGTVNFAFTYNSVPTVVATVNSNSTVNLFIVQVHSITTSSFQYVKYYTNGITLNAAVSETFNYVALTS